MRVARPFPFRAASRGAESPALHQNGNRGNADRLPTPGRTQVHGARVAVGCASPRSSPQWGFAVSHGVAVVPSVTLSVTHDAEFAQSARKSANLGPIFRRGGMAEWSMALVLKTTVPGRVPGVRIPLPPPDSIVRFLSVSLLPASFPR